VKSRRLTRLLLPAIAAGAVVHAQEAPPPGENVWRRVEAGDSVDRVRAALDKPPSKLTLRERTPDFTVHIEKRRPMQDIFDVPPWQLEPHGWQPPAVGFDLLSVFRSVAKSVSEAKRGHDERMAREDVQRAIADYCATVEDRAAIQICSTSPASR
jgi:hypothetical protein